MSRPEVSVVMPFAGDRAGAEAAIAALASLLTAPGDELILADNSGVVPEADAVTVVRAVGEQSPAHARNVGAERATRDWILFLDADCRAREDLLDAYFAQPVARDVGALVGEVLAAAGGETLAERYGAARSFLSQQNHLAHPYLPRAVAANLLVRRDAFRQIGGFYEGVRAAEDTDFSWRLQRAGWRLELRPSATVEHRYRATLGELRRQWRGYAAGRAWLARRYEGFVPEPAARRALRRGLARVRRGGGSPGIGRVPAARSGAPSPPRSGAGEPRGYRVLDALLAGEELAGLALSNRPGSAAGRPAGALNEIVPTRVVVVAERFPVPGDPLVDFVRTLRGARVEAAARPEVVPSATVRALQVSYREDDGTAARCLALLKVASRHPVRCVRDGLLRRPGQPTLPALAPAVLRLLSDPGARVHAIGGEETQMTGRRIAALGGRRFEPA